MDRKFKVGDRVEFVCNNAPFLKGCTGEIKDIQEVLFPYPYIVKGEVSAEMFEPCGLTLQTADLLISELNSFVRDFSCQTPPMTDLPLIQNNKLLTDIQLD